MSKPSDDLSALFRSLRPDETTFQESTNTVARDAEQRWPLFKAVAPVKPQETPVLSALERQRWANQEQPQVGGRKPALSLPGLSDKMSKGLDKMSVRAVKNTGAVKPAVRREPEKPLAERVVQRPRSVRAASTQKASTLENCVSNVGRALPAEPTVVVSGTGLGALDKKPTVLASTSVAPERDLPVAGHGDASLKSIFSRLESKTELAPKPAGNLSSFLDRLGKR